MERKYSLIHKIENNFRKAEAFFVCKEIVILVLRLIFSYDDLIGFENL